MKEGLTFIQLIKEYNKIITEKNELESTLMNSCPEALVKAVEDRLDYLNDLLEEYETMPLHTINYVYDKINTAKAWED